MFKYIILVVSFMNAYILLNNIINDAPISTFTMAIWGGFFIFMLLLASYKLFVFDGQRQAAIVRYKEIVDPIMKDVNLTESEKKEKIKEKLNEELVKQLNITIGGKK